MPVIGAFALLGIPRLRLRLRPIDRSRRSVRPCAFDLFSSKVDSPIRSLRRLRGVRESAGDERRRAWER